MEESIIQIEKFNILLQLQAHVQLFISGVESLKIQENKDFYSRKYNLAYHTVKIKEKIDLLRVELNKENIMQGELPIIEDLIGFMPYLEFCRTNKKPVKSIYFNIPPKRARKRGENSDVTTHYPSHYI
jgi:hypothetical protein